MFALLLPVGSSVLQVAHDEFVLMRCTWSHTVVQPQYLPHTDHVNTVGQ